MLTIQQLTFAIKQTCFGQKFKIHVFVEMFQTHFAVKSDKRDKLADQAAKTSLYWTVAAAFVFTFKVTIPFFLMDFLLSPSSVCTNLWGLKVGAPPVADAVIDHPVLFHTILPSKDLTHKQMLMNL